VLDYKPFISKALSYGPCVTSGSHSFTCHPHTNHTCLYSPAARCHRPLAGTHCAYPQRMARLSWPGCVWTCCPGLLHEVCNSQHGTTDVL